MDAWYGANMAEVSSLERKLMLQSGWYEGMGRMETLERRFRAHLHAFRQLPQEEQAYWRAVVST